MKQRCKHLAVPALPHLLSLEAVLDLRVFPRGGRPTPLAFLRRHVSNVKTDGVCFCCSKSQKNPRRGKGSPVINADRQTTLDPRSPHNELGNHHSSHKRNSRRVSFFVWRLQSDLSAAVILVRWKPLQRPPLAIAWIPANSVCDIQAPVGGAEANGPLLFPTDVTVHSAPDHQTDGLCVAQNASDSCKPSSCPRLPCLLGWHPRQKSHHSHDMVAPLA